MKKFFITYKELKEQDLCFEEANEEYLYDANTIDEFCERIIEDISGETDCTEFQIACEKLIKKSKKLLVFKKDYFNMTANRIKDYIQDYANDNFGNAFIDYEVVFSEKSDELLNQFVEELLKNNQTYTSDISIGFIDLSKYVKEAIKDYCDENPII